MITNKRRSYRPTMRKLAEGNVRGNWQDNSENATKTICYGAKIAKNRFFFFFYRMQS